MDKDIAGGWAINHLIKGQERKKWMEINSFNRFGYFLEDERGRRIKFTYFIFQLLGRF